MDIPTESSTDADRRDCVRIGLTGFPCEAVLSDGTSTLQAECVNQSAEGFGLRCEQSVPWSIDQKLMLNKGGLWHEVKLVYVGEQDGEHKIGLKRLSDCNDYQGPSPFRVLWREIRRLGQFKFASNMQILGIGSAFLLCIVVLFIVLNPTAPLKSGSRSLSVLFSGVEEDEYQRGSGQRHRSTGLRAKSKSSSRNVDRRVTALVSRPQEITWNDLEGALDLTKVQSRQLLSLLHGDSGGATADQIDTTKIVIDNRKDFAAFLQSLPAKAFEFLSQRQRQSLQSMLKMMNQP